MMKGKLREMDINTTALTFKTLIVGIVAYISDKLGFLGWLLGCLLGLMLIDFVTGILASLYEKKLSPSDDTKGISSKRGSIGVAKKVLIILAIGAVMIVDAVIYKICFTFNLTLPFQTMFSLITTLWFIFNEFISILENVVRRDVPIPEWLIKFAVLLKVKVDKKAEEEIAKIE